MLRASSSSRSLYSFEPALKVFRCSSIWRIFSLSALSSASVLVISAFIASIVA